jgi:two-component system alkaline phosphatase synthesis response regulator PhoP
MIPAILIVEDEESLSRTLALNLKMEGYEPVVATTGNKALELFRERMNSIDLALLDVMLPGINGYELCREFKKMKPMLPVIFLTAKNQTAEKIEGLKLGADDYIVKPFELEELLLRISNVLKRNARVSHEFTFDGGRINYDTFEVTDFRGSNITLSKREIALLKLLTENVNRVISRDEIIEKLWNDEENASSRTIDNYILAFRKYFEKVPRQPRHFHSIRGVGYKFTP